jgi:hypothetical protein
LFRSVGFMIFGIGCEIGVDGRWMGVVGVGYQQIGEKEMIPAFVSDLFFNLEHDDTESDEKLLRDAEWLIDGLRDLGVEVLFSPYDLVTDFDARL